MTVVDEVLGVPPDESPAPETGTVGDVLSVYLTQYESMRAETASRFQ